MPVEFEIWRLLWMLVLFEWCVFSFHTGVWWSRMYLRMRRYQRAEMIRPVQILIIGVALMCFGTASTVLFRAARHFYAGVHEGPLPLSDWESYVFPYQYTGSLCIVAGFIIMTIGTMTKNNYRAQLIELGILHVLGVGVFWSLGGFEFSYV